MKISELIKERRKELGLTLEAVATAVSVDRATVLRWERGEIKSVKGEKLNALADCLCLPVSAFLDGEGYRQSGQSLFPLFAVQGGALSPTGEELPVSPLPPDFERDGAFLYRVKGTESRQFQSGDLLLLNRTDGAREGKILLVLKDGTAKFMKAEKLTDVREITLLGEVSAMFREF